MGIVRPDEVAAERFSSRERHPGPLDRLRTPQQHKAGVQSLHESFRGPLGLSDTAVTLDTSRVVDLHTVVDQVQAAMAAVG